MVKIFIEENGVYEIDCTQAIWATDQMHEAYHTAGIPLKDSDFIIENETELYMVEYKNAIIPNAVNAEAFHPEDSKRFQGVVQKFYDSLHYLNLLGKTKPVQYVYILEYLLM